MDVGGLTVDSNLTPTSGTSIEIFYGSTGGVIQSFDRDNSNLEPLRVRGSTWDLALDGSATFSNSVYVGGDASDLVASSKNVSYMGAGPIVSNRASSSNTAISVRLNGVDKTLLKSDGSASFTGTILNNPTDDTYAFQVNAGSTNLGGLYKETSSSRLILGDGSTTKIDLQGAYGNGTFTGQLIVGGSTLLSHPNMDDLQVGNASGNRGLTICSGTTGYGSVCFGDSADGSGNDRYEGYVEYYHNDNSLRLGTSHTEKVNITSAGDIRMGPSSFGAPKCKLDIIEDTTIPYSVTTTGSIDFIGMMIRHQEYCEFSVRFTQDLVNTSLLLKFSRNAHAPSIGVNYYGSGGYQIDHSVSGNAYISFLSSNGATLYSGTTQQAAYGARSTTWSHTNGTSDVILKISNCAYSIPSIYHFTVNIPRGGINGITVDRTTP